MLLRMHFKFRDVAPLLLARAVVIPSKSTMQLLSYNNKGKHEDHDNYGRPGHPLGCALGVGILSKEMVAIVTCLTQGLAGSMLRLVM